MLADDLPLVGSVPVQNGNVVAASARRAGSRRSPFEAAPLLVVTMNFAPGWRSLSVAAVASSDPMFT